MAKTIDDIASMDITINTNNFQAQLKASDTLNLVMIFSEANERLAYLLIMFVL